MSINQNTSDAMPKRPKRTRRLSRQDWLDLSMEALSRRSGARITIDRVCDELGVTKGSFYGHFRNRADFIKQLVGHWDAQYTQVVITRLSEAGDLPPSERLLELMREIGTGGLARYDNAVRAWAAQDETVAKLVGKVYRRRFQFVRSIFQDLGFKGAELEMRTRVFVIYHSSEQGVPSLLASSRREEELLLRHAFFIGR